MIIRIIMDNKVYQFFVKLVSKVVDYLNGMYTQPKYIALRALFTAIVPDISIVLFALLSYLKL